MDLTTKGVTTQVVTTKGVKTQGVTIQGDIREDATTWGIKIKDFTI